MNKVNTNVLVEQSKMNREHLKINIHRLNFNKVNANFTKVRCKMKKAFANLPIESIPALQTVPEAPFSFRKTTVFSFL
jgi:hypothetical protein